MSYRHTPDRHLSWTCPGICLGAHFASVYRSSGDVFLEAIEDDGVGQIEQYCQQRSGTAREIARIGWLPLLRKIGVVPEQLARIECKAALPADWRE